MSSVSETNNETPSHSFLALCLYAASKLRHTTVTCPSSHMGGQTQAVWCQEYAVNVSVHPPLYQGNLVQWGHKETVNYSEYSSINYRYSRLEEQG